MGRWWERKLPLFGGVLFRGDLPPQPEDFAYLSDHEIMSIPNKGNSSNAWSLKLTHPSWGNAEIAYQQDIPLPPRELFEYTFMSEADKNAAISARSILTLRMESKHDHILRDRKLMLRFLSAIMGSDGVVAMDHTAQKVWTRGELGYELCHDADLDVAGIINMQAVSEDNKKPFWVHSHGLSDIGCFDFDIFEPCEDALYQIHEISRAMAFHILEGSIKPSMAEFELVSPGGRIKMVPMNQFLASTDPERRARLNPSINDDHKRNRSVICEPEVSGFGRLFAKKTLQPSRLLSGRIPDNPVFGFSTSASDLMAERAKKTYSMLCALKQEFDGFDFMFCVKLGFTTVGAAFGGKEHVWFEVNELFDDTIDGTLLNQPYAIPGMKEGDRGRHPLDLLSDWMIMTPVGMINPRSTSAASIIRAAPDKIRKMIG